MASGELNYRGLNFGGGVLEVISCMSEKLNLVFRIWIYIYMDKSEFNQSRVKNEKLNLNKISNTRLQIEVVLQASLLK